MWIKYRRQLRIEKTNKKQTNKEIFELDEVVKISRFLIINSKKIFAGALNLIIAKKSMKRNWKIKWKNMDQKRDYYKVQIIANEEEITELKKGSR